MEEQTIHIKQTAAQVEKAFDKILSGELETIHSETLAAGGEAQKSAAAAATSAATAQAASANEEQRILAETQRASQETARVDAEAARVSAETARAEAEATRGRIEEARVRSESDRFTAEYARNEAESARADAEGLRATAETARAEAEAARAQAETARETAETTRSQAETAREAAEIARANAEGLRAQSETARADAEAARAQSETARETAEARREDLETGYVAAAKAEADRAEAAAQQVVEVIDHQYHRAVLAAKSTDEVDALFARWWQSQWTGGKSSRVELLDRWFGQVLYDDRVHGVKLPLFATSSSAIGELTDDSAALACEPSTEAHAGRDDFAYLPQFWAVEVAAEKRPDGSHEIYAVEHIDPIETVRSGEHLCWVLQKNTYTKEWTDGSYHYLQMRCRPGQGWTQWPQGTDRTGRTYAYIGNPKYAAGLDAHGRITCGTDLEPATYLSHSSGVAKWRERGKQYSGASGCLLRWQLSMIALKYGRKGNSGLIEGCSSYYVEAKAAAPENGVQRILIPQGQGSKFLLGSTVSIGTRADRWGSDTYNVAKSVRITKIHDVQVGGASYTAMEVDHGGVPFDVPAGANIFSMPYRPGYNDGVRGYDGSRTSPTSGKETGLIQKTEFMMGAYLILSDEIWSWSKTSAGEFAFDCYACHDQSKVSPSSITADYHKQSDLTMRFAPGTKDGWQHIEDVAIGQDRGVLWPQKVSTAAGSGTGCKAGFYAQPRESGLRGAWCCGTLSTGGNAGLPARNSNNGLTDAYYSGCVGAPGLSG